jgi:hypothetical protein
MRVRRYVRKPPRRIIIGRRSLIAGHPSRPGVRRRFAAVISRRYGSDATDEVALEALTRRGDEVQQVMAAQCLLHLAQQ